MQFILAFFVFLNIIIINSLKQFTNFYLDKDETTRIDISPPSLLAEKGVSRINTLLNPLKYGANYLVGTKYIDEQQEYNIKNTIINNYTSKTCFFNRQKFIEYLNIIREKHSVSKIKWNRDLENQAKIFAINTKEKNKCLYNKDPKRKYFAEAIYQGPVRITEKELLQKWYTPAYFNYNFVNATYNLDFDKKNSYPMTLMLWDDVSSVGCAKVCCDNREFYVCHFYPVILDQDILMMSYHIKPNKYLIPIDKQNGAIK